MRDALGLRAPGAGPVDLDRLRRRCAAPLRGAGLRIGWPGSEWMRPEPRAWVLLGRRGSAQGAVYSAG